MFFNDKIERDQNVIPVSLQSVIKSFGVIIYLPFNINYKIK